MKAMLLDRESPMSMNIYKSMCESLNEEIKKVEKELLKLINEEIIFKNSLN